MKKVPHRMYLRQVGSSRKNPRISTAELAEAVDMSKRIQGREAKEGTVIEFPDVPRVVIKVGELHQINYTRMERGKRIEYYHRFNRPRPVLVTDGKGKALWIAGGSYRVGEKGIEG